MVSFCVSVCVLHRDPYRAGRTARGFGWCCCGASRGTATEAGRTTGIPGQHILPVEARDLYIEARTEKLRKNMAAAGEDIPPKGSHCAAHHIVPVEHESSPLFEESRNILKECGIDINSAENGVFLPDSRKPSSFCAGRTYHRDLHTNLYARKLFLKLNDAMENDGCDGVHKALQEIKQDLKDGVSWR